MGAEDATERVAIMIGDAFAVDLAGCRIKERNQVGNAVAPVIEVLDEWATRHGRPMSAYPADNK